MSGSSSIATTVCCSATACIVPRPARGASAAGTDPARTRRPAPDACRGHVEGSDPAGWSGTCQLVRSDCCRGGERGAAMRWALIIGVSITMCAVAGCGSDGAGEGGSPAPPSAPTPACSRDYPFPLGITTDRPDEVPYLSQMSACTNVLQTATLISNESDAAWSLSASGGAQAQEVAGDQVEHLVSGLASQLLGTQVLAPHSSVVVFAAPERV